MATAIDAHFNISVSLMGVPYRSAEAGGGARAAAGTASDSTEITALAAHLRVIVGLAEGGASRRRPIFSDRPQVGVLQRHRAHPLAGCRSDRIEDCGRRDRNRGLADTTPKSA
jgi:hypothetical protein